jgi:hypothetical protein
MPSSYIAETRQQTLWARILHKASFFIETSVRLRTCEPNLAWIIEKVDSTFERLW